MNHDDASLSDRDRRLDALFDRVLSMLEDGEDVDPHAVTSDLDCTPLELQQAMALARGTLAQSGLLSRTLLPEIEGFEILAELGRGGMSLVYAARQHSLGGRVVALKILPASVALSPNARRRFLDEARAIARFRHRHIVSIHDVIDQPNVCAYAMELVEGATLAAVIAESSWSGGVLVIDRVRAVVSADNRAVPDRAGSAFIARVGLAVASALQVVHEAGLVHRDVKPSNILIRRDGTPLLSDFGLVRDVDSSIHTVDGAFVGTLAYAPPEQLRGDHRAVDARSDVYSLGATLYHGLTGRRVVEGNAPAELVRAIEQAAIPPLRKINREIGRDLETVVMTAIDPEPDRRYPTAGAMAEDLERVLSFRAIKTKPAGPITRSRRFARRHRRALLGAIGGGVAVLVLLIIAWTALIARPAAARARLDDARLALIDPAQATMVTMRLMWGDEWTPRQQSPDHTARAVELYDAAITLDPFSDVARRERAMVAAAGRIAQRETLDDTFDDATASLPATRAYARARVVPLSWDGVERDDARCLGLIAYLVFDVDTAVAAWSVVERRGDADPFVEAALGQVYLWRGEPGRSYPRLQHAVEAFPDVGFLLVNLADTAVRCGDLDRAERLLDRASNATGLDTTGGLDRVRADWLVATGRSDEARPLYERHVMTSPIACLHLGMLLESEGDDAGALAAYERHEFKVAEMAARYLDLAARRWHETPWIARAWQVWRLTTPDPSSGVSLGHFRAVQAAIDRLRGLSFENAPIGSALRARTSAPNAGTTLADLAQRLEARDMQLWNMIKRSNRATRAAALGALALGASADDVRRGLIAARRWRAVTLGLLSAAATTGATTGAANAGGEITFSEDDFGPGSYATEVVQAGAGGGSSVLLVADGGTPGSFVSIQHTLPGGPPPGEWCAYWVWTFVMIDGAIVDPGAVGGITAVDFAISSLPIDAENANIVQSHAFCLRQDDRLYINAGGVTPGGDTWSTLTATDLVAEDFFEVVSEPPCAFTGESHPDFSPAGGPIELGFARGNSTSIGGNDVPTMIETGADAWSAVVSVGAQFIPLGTLPDETESIANRISGDGSTVVGHSFTNTGEAFRWRENEGLVPLGDLPGDGFGSVAIGCNADGSMVAGYSLSGAAANADCGVGPNWEGLLWSEDDGPSGLGFPTHTCNYSQVIWLSDDGALAAGGAINPEGYVAHVRTIPGGWSSLNIDVLPGQSELGRVISGTPDGLVLVGAHGNPGSGPWYAFRWEAGDYVLLPDLPGGSDFGDASGISADGSRIVGYGTTDTNQNATLWIDGEVNDLGDFEGGSSSALASAITRDGALIVGRGTDAGGFRAAIWDEDLVLHDLETWLADRSLALPAGWTLQSASDIRRIGDQVMICGYGLNANGLHEGFIARVPYEPSDPDPCPADLDGDGVVGSADLAVLLSSWGDCPGCDADFDEDDAVTSADLSVLLAAWGPCPD